MLCGLYLEGGVSTIEQRDSVFFLGISQNSTPYSVVTAVLFYGVSQSLNTMEFTWCFGGKN